MIKRTFVILCVMAALPLFPRPAQAIYMTGKDLVRACMSDAQKDIHDCLGYVSGVIDYHMMMQSLGTAPTIDFCMPDGVTIEQATVIVMKYLRKSPQNGDFIAAPAVTLALHEAFPCAPATPTRRHKK